MTIHIWDGMAVLRRRFDKDPLGQGPRKVIMDMMTSPRSNVDIWCWEGRGAAAVRRKTFPGYKERPSTMTDGLHALVDLTRQALRHTRALQIAVPGREADDVIAHLCEVHGPTVKDGIIVHTIDRDLTALATDKVKLDCDPLSFTLEPATETTPKKVLVIPAAEVRLFKTLVGDTSDRIPGAKGFGEKAYAACERRLLHVALAALLGGQAVPALWVKAGVKPGMAERICAPEQAELLRAYWAIIGFLPMPGDWEDGIVSGKEDYAAADAILREFHH